jgi:hypothetical protein
VRVQYRRSDFEEGGVCGCGWRLRAPDDSVKNLRGHQSAVEEGSVRHCRCWDGFGGHAAGGGGFRVLVGVEGCEVHVLLACVRN